MKSNNPTLESVRSQIVSKLYCLAHTLDLQIRSGAGAAMLGLDPALGLDQWPSYAEFDLSNVSMDEDLISVYRYAFFNELNSVGFSDDVEEGQLGRLAALSDMVVGTYLISRNEGDVHDCHGNPFDVGDGYSDMIKRAKARYELDFHPSVSLENIAVLAEIDERSARNALHAPGDAMLMAYRDQGPGHSGESQLRITKQEALRWLHRYGKFLDTVRVGSFGDVPKFVLGKEQLFPFLRDRLNEIFPIENGSTPEEILNYRYDVAGSSIGISAAGARALFERPMAKLTAEDFYLIAQMIYLDFAWLREQAEKATGKKLVVNEREVRASLPTRPTSPLNEVAGTLEVKLTEAGIRNGYFNIDRRYADRFFPADVYGERGAGDTGNPIALHHDSRGSPYVTDLRVKSDLWVSPRKRFSAYFTAHDSKEGDRIQFKKTGERTYELTYLGQ